MPVSRSRTAEAPRSTASWFIVTERITFSWLTDYAFRYRIINNNNQAISPFFQKEKKSERYLSRLRIDSSYLPRWWRNKNRIPR